MAEERRVQRLIEPIYDAIDSRNYEKALKLCDSKKVGKFEITQALKAHALERTGRIPEALKICRTLQAAKSTDERVLNILQLTFRMCGKVEEATISFEHALAINPNDEDVALQLFYCYTRQFSFLKQQTTAMHLYKRFGKQKYLCWACLCMLMQVQVGDSPPTMLVLAEKLMTKALTTISPSSEAVLLLLDILLEQKKIKEALEAFDKFTLNTSQNKNEKPRALEGLGMDSDIELGSMQEIDRLTLKASLCQKLEKHAECYEIYDNLITNFDLDGWNFYQGLITSATALGTLDDLHTLIKSKYQKLNQADLLRGPFLAEISVLKEQESKDIVNVIVKYIDRFATKPCCFTDLKPYYDYLLETHPTAVNSTTTAGNNNTALTTLLHTMRTLPLVDVNSIRKRVFSLKSLRYIGNYKNYSQSQLEILVTEITAEYQDSLKLSSISSEQREIQPFDDFILLGAHFLIDAHNLSPGSKYYIQDAITLLQVGLSHSAFNFQFKILQCHLLGVVGAPSASYDRFLELDIKQIQLDSCSYLIYDRLLVGGMFKEASNLCKRICKMHYTSAIDAPESIVKAYKLGVTSKAAEITAFQRQKMAKSAQLAMAQAELVNLGMLSFKSSSDSVVDYLDSYLSNEGGGGLHETTMFPFKNDDDACFNQDKSVCVTYDSINHANSYMYPRSGKVVNVDKLNGNTAVSWLKLRTAVPKLLHCAFTLSAAVDFATEETLVRNLIQNDLLLLEDLSQVECKIWNLVLTASTVVRHVKECATDKAVEWQVATDALRTLEGEWNSLEICSSLSEVRRSSVAYVQSVLSIFLSQGGYWSLLLVCSAFRYLPKKKKEMKAAAEGQQEFAAQLVQTVESMQRCFTELKEFISGCEKDEEEDHYTGIPFLLQDQYTDIRLTIRNKVKESRNTSMNEFLSLIEQQSNLLQSLQI